MSEGIKIRELQSVGGLQKDDVFIIDNIIDGNLGTATTLNIRYEDVLQSITGEDLNFTGNISFDGNIVFDGDVEINLDDLTDVTIDSTLTTGQGLVYNGSQWVNGEVLSGSVNGDYIALEAKTNDPCSITVTVADKVGHRYPPNAGTSSDKCFYLDGIEAPFLILSPGRTYKFDQSDPTNADHPLAFWSTRDSYFSPISESYITRFGTPGTGGAYTEIELVNDMKYKYLYYQCTNHPQMGNGLMNPDGDDTFDNIGPYIDTLQRQIDDLNSKIS